MQLNNKITLLLITLTLVLISSTITVRAEDANKNGVIVLGECWSTYTPANYDHSGVWGYYTYSDDLSVRNRIDETWRFGPDVMSSNWIMFGHMLVDRNNLANPGWSWPFGAYTVDQAGNGLWAVEYNPSEEFAAINDAIHGTLNRNYAFLHYNTRISGSGDPTRDYHIPAEGGAVIDPDRNFAWTEHGWPTQMGVDVKLKAYSWSTNYAQMDNFHIVEIEFYNTGECDVNGDGNVDITNNRINALCAQYIPQVFSMWITNSGTRGYFNDNHCYRGCGQDLTPDEDGFPWAIGVQGHGSSVGTEHRPAVSGNTNMMNKGYNDQYNVYTWLGAKKVDDAGNIIGDKNLCFKDANGEEIVPAVGEGAQRDWFTNWSPGYNNLAFGGEVRGIHTMGMGEFFLDGGKSNSGDKYDLHPNPNMFVSGDAMDVTTWVVKPKSEWQYPDGNLERCPSSECTDENGVALGKNPKDPERHRPLAPGDWTEGRVTEYRFDAHMHYSCGPFALEPGERMRVYFVRANGFRLLGARKAIKTARAVYASMQSDGTFEVPQAPPVPDIKIESKFVENQPEAVIKWQDVSAMGDYDGVKIYRSSTWPRFNTYEKGYPDIDTFWKTTDPTNPAKPAEISPLMTDLDYLNPAQGRDWGPYSLIKVIPKAELGNYLNEDSDNGTYKYSWLDDTGTMLGQTYWYYVATYKNNPSVPSAFQGLETANWIETGKVNINGRSGKWESTWPWANQHSFYPDASDAAALKDLGAPYVLMAPPADTRELDQNIKKILVKPNPYKRVAFHDTQGQHNIMFINLPAEGEITIMDVSGQIVDRIHFRAPDENTGVAFWDMFSKDGNEVASGLYIWVCEYDNGKGQQSGVFSIMR